MPTNGFVAIVFSFIPGYAPTSARIRHDR
jgi:hypothetical protein